jgi:asparagine synthase (glutamine-hydrolysing)
VKVLISGEGGDEAFGGYQVYRNFLWLERFKSLIKPFRGGLSSGASALNRVLRSDRIGKYAPLLNVPFESYYYSGTSNRHNYFDEHFEELYSKEFAPLVNRGLSAGVVERYVTKGNIKDLVNRMLYVDTKTWLPDDLLLKADKMTMANSIELRVPFLDHKVLEFAASLPGSYKVHGFTTKYILKKLLSERVPQEILTRKKVGFPVPIANWLRTDLKGWVRELLLDRETLDRGYFDKNCIEQLISQNDVRGGFYSKEIFSLVALELWHREFVGNRSSIPRPRPLETVARSTTL